jgi:hypothetical protein
MGAFLAPVGVPEADAHLLHQLINFNSRKVIAPAHPADHAAELLEHAFEGGREGVGGGGHVGQGRRLGRHRQMGASPS